jgi:hypothetical protein
VVPNVTLVSGNGLMVDAGGERDADPGDKWPAYLIERTMEPPPGGCCVVRGSTPVVAFGRPVGPAVATLGINPSSSEFLARNGSLLAGHRRRLATMDSLGLAVGDQIGEAAAAAIIGDCARYFHRKPYHWFNPLNRVLRDALGVSYWDGTASHLDLVQWATAPVWGGLDSAVRVRLLDADTAFLSRQLIDGGYRLVVVNGRTAMDWVERAGLVAWHEERRLTGPPSARVCIGDAGGRRFVGWSCNLQSQHGARALAPELAASLAGHGLQILSSRPT